MSRDDVPTWSMPTVHEVNGRTQLIVNGMRHIGAYDFKTGEVIWKMKGLGTSRTDAGHVRRLRLHHQRRPAGSPVFAIKESATGDISLAGRIDDQ